MSKFAVVGAFYSETDDCPVAEFYGLYDSFDEAMNEVVKMSSGEVKFAAEAGFYCGSTTKKPNGIIVEYGNNMSAFYVCPCNEKQLSHEHN